MPRVLRPLHDLIDECLRRYYLDVTYTPTIEGEWPIDRRTFTLRNWHVEDGPRCPRKRDLSKCRGPVDAQESIRNAPDMARTDFPRVVGAARVVFLDLHKHSP
jgi:hypothetical protein